MIRHNRKNRMRTTELKALRKLRIVKEQNDYWHYEFFGMYRKGKIHCSCPMCSSKTNSSNNKSHGPTYQNPVDPETGRSIPGRRGSRLCMTNKRYGKKNWSMKDRKRIDCMKDQIEEAEQEEAYGKSPF